MNSTMKPSARVCTMLFIMTLIPLCMGMAGQTKEPEPNTLTKKEQNEGWKLLFNGKTTNGWRGGKEFLAHKAESKFKERKDFGEAEKGHILLQDHGDTVYFRNIKIRTF